MTRLSLLSVTLFLTALSLNAMAAETAATSVTNTGTSSAASVLDSVYLNLFSTFHGPSVQDMGAHTVDRNGVLSAGGINFDSELNAAYLLSKDVGVGIVLPFIYTPVYGQDLSLGDIGVKAFDKHAIVAGGLNVYANAIIQAPSSQYSRDRGQVLALKTTPNVRYNFSGTRFATGAWTEAKAYLGVTSGKAFKLYANPYVNYQLTSGLSLNLSYEMEWDHMVGMPGYLNFTTYQTDLQPGLVYMITPKIMVNPYLQVFTTNQVSRDNMALGAVMSASL